MRVRTRADDPLVVQWVCAVCGRPFVLANGDEGSEIPDRSAFLTTHENCLHVSLPEQRRPARPS